MKKLTAKNIPQNIDFLGDKIGDKILGFKYFRFHIVPYYSNLVHCFSLPLRIYYEARKIIESQKSVIAGDKQDRQNQRHLNNIIKYLFVGDKIGDKIVNL